MSDQEFRGIAPKTPAGESIFFYSLDYWIGLCECIRMIIDESFPPYPSMEAETAENVAELLERRLEFGLVRAYFELEARRTTQRSGYPGCGSRGGSWRVCRDDARLDQAIHRLPERVRRLRGGLKHCGPSVGGGLPTRLSNGPRPH